MMSTPQKRRNLGRELALDNRLYFHRQSYPTNLTHSHHTLSTFKEKHSLRSLGYGRVNAALLNRKKIYTNERLPSLLRSILTS